MLIGLLSLSLEPASADGTLRVRTDVAGVSVLIDGQPVGQTPATIGPVSSGRHRVTLTKPGYQDHDEDIEVKDGAVVRVFVVMTPMEVTMPSFPIYYRAVHQHSPGGCAGQITVEAGVVNYRGDDGQDVFTFPIRDVRSVARSAGPVLSISFNGTTYEKKWVGVIPIRIETAERSAGFWASDLEILNGDPATLVEATANKTKELFEVLYRIWSTSLKN
jgi:hypothetical protein